MLASLFHLKSLGCCGCISTLIVLSIAAVLLLVVLGIVSPDIIVPDGIDHAPVLATICHHIPLEGGPCPTPVP